MMRVAENLEWSLTYYMERPEHSVETLEGLFRTDRAGLLDASAKLLDAAPSATGTVFLVNFLLRKGVLLDLIRDPARLRIESATQVADTALRADGSFDRTLAEALLDEDNADQRERLLAVLCAIRLRPEVVKTLAGLISDPSPRIHSKIALLLARVDPDGDWIASALADPDSRVRANVHEAFWDRPSRNNRALFMRGLADPARRVRSNAAYGLYQMGDAASLHEMQRLLRSPDLLDRRSGLWLVEKTRDVRFQPALAKMVAEPEGDLRSRALRVLRVLKKREDEARAQGAIQLEAGARVLPGSRLELLVRTSRAFGPMEWSAAQGDLLLLDFELEALNPAEQASIVVAAPWAYADRMPPDAALCCFAPAAPLAATRSAAAPAPPKRSLRGFRMLGVEVAEEEEPVSVPEPEAPPPASPPASPPAPPQGSFADALITAYGAARAPSGFVPVFILNPDGEPAPPPAGVTVHVAHSIEHLTGLVNLERLRQTANLRIVANTPNPANPVTFTVASVAGYGKTTAMVGVQGLEPRASSV